VWLTTSVVAFAVTLPSCRQNKNAPARPPLENASLRAATEAPQEVYEAARRDLGRFLATISPDHLNGFNFSTPEELRTATLGTPYPMFWVEPDAFEHLRSNATILDVIRPMSRWFFPVLAGTKYRTMLTVAIFRGTWAAIEIGSSDLAPEFASMLAKWPTSKGYRYIFVRSEETRSEFVILLHQEAMKIFPLHTAMRVWGLERGELLHPAQVVSFLTDAFRKHSTQ
jgi:hypothetical protein